ncbi:hypothetical protein [Streptomyces sp. SID3343]|uniref:hypothetical protein n=1 Tax=Streptomyces sp. SID3343 TaxID=2690260 RepID=UPI00136E8721|nr:hypothetical protein [Streptomyces sp. SID3343]MYW04953.1 hypothetical protein [Streptomyces sp. SID3343]
MKRTRLLGRGPAGLPVLLALVAAGTASPVGFAAHALPVPVVQTCTGFQSETFTPGLNSTLRQVAGEGNGELTSCLPFGDSLPASGRVTSTMSGEMSCSGGARTRTTTITWDDGGSSTLEESGGVESPVGGGRAAVFKGEIRSGRFAGATTITTRTLSPLPKPQCATEVGLTEASGPLAVEITRLL